MIGMIGVHHPYFFPTTHGGRKMHFQGHNYYRSCTNADGTVTYWRCVRAKSLHEGGCRGSARTDELDNVIGLPTPHNHPAIQTFLMPF
ncbi:hypothetical protein niasHT_000745 [Heterodera trifolii]|uniref:FLYWCH-type domain-containing protein n=1 Tax=Heterodera trifolii TaxID=157864 RepID=A0ABD2LP53_9BILA